MRYVAKLLKGVSSLLSFSLVFGALIIQQAYAAECNPACPNGCNPDGTCKIVDVPMVEDPVVDEDSPSWGDLDDQTQSSVARNQVRFDATGGDEAAQEVYDQQQSRRDQQSANQSTYDNTVSDIQKNLEEQKAKNNERVKNMEQLTQQAQKDYEDAQKRLQSATTPEEMKAANEALKQAKENLEKAKDAQKEVEKEVKKENKALEKEAKSDTKAAEKALKEQQKALEKEQKAQRKAIEKEQERAEDDLKDANKTIKKLEERCAKGKCDDEDLADLAAARAAAQQAQAALDAANQKAAAFNAEDDDVAAQNYIDERDAEEAAKQALENAPESDQELQDALKDIEDAQSAAPKMCSEVEGNIFLLIACKAMITLADLRVIAYIISGFGMIALAYAAILGKMSFKHLANIGIGLFLLSMMTPFIEYFTTGKDGTLRFGKYLPAGFTDIQGSDGSVAECDEDANMDSEFCSQMLPEVTVTAKKEKWTLKDLKGSIEAGLNAVRNASNMYKAAKSTVSNVSNTISNMSAQIKAGGGGLDGILNAAGAISNATSSIVNSGQTLANNWATNAGELSSNFRDVGATNAEREARAQLEADTQKLANKCNAGNCSDKEKAYLEYMQQQVQENKTGLNQWLEDDGKGGGSTILSGLNKVGDITQNAANTVSSATTAAHEGQSIGGDGALGTILGVGFGLGTGITEGMDMVSEGQNNGSFDFRSEETKRTQAEQAAQAAYQQTADYVKSETRSGDTTVQNLGDGSIKTINEKTGTTTVINPNGTTTITGKDGTTIVKNKDGSKVVTDANGNQITYDAQGNKTDTQLVNPYNRPTAESMEDALNGGGEQPATPQTRSGESPTSETGDTPKSETEEKTETPQAMTDAQRQALKQKCSRYTGAYEALKSKCEACTEKSTNAEIDSCMQAVTDESKCYDEKFKENCFDTGEPKEACTKCNFQKRAQEKEAEKQAAILTDTQKEARCTNSCQIAKRKEQCMSDCKNLLASVKTQAEANQKMTEFNKTFYEKYNK